jgi:hypothetical protein
MLHPATYFRSVRICIRGARSPHNDAFTRIATAILEITPMTLHELLTHRCTADADMRADSSVVATIVHLWPLLVPNASCLATSPRVAKAHSTETYIDGITLPHCPLPLSLCLRIVCICDRVWDSSEAAKEPHSTDKRGSVQ